MKIEDFRQMSKAQPFRPFTIHLADGREIPVLHQEFVMIVGGGRTAIVAQPSGTFDIIDLLLVTDLEVRPPAAAPAS